MIDQKINELENEFTNNEKSINKNKGIIHELKLYDFEERIGRVGLLGTMLFLPVWLGTFFLGVPTIFAPLINIVGSYGLGSIINLSMEKKAKCKERFRKISNSKNESERIEEVLINEMNIERLKHRNEIIAKVNDKTKEDDQIVQKLSTDKLFLIKFKKSNYSKDELEKRINDIESQLVEKYELLDKLSNEVFIKNIENKSNDKFSQMFYSMITTSVTLLLSVLSLFPIMMNPLHSPSLIPLITTFGLGGLVFRQLPWCQENSRIEKIGLGDSIFSNMVGLVLRLTCPVKANKNNRLSIKSFHK